MLLPTTNPSAPVTAADGEPVPRGQDCIARVNVGTPSKYVCDGKTYTSHELRKLREDGAAQRQPDRQLTTGGSQPVRSEPQGTQNGTGRHDRDDGGYRRLRWRCCAWR